MEVRQAIEELRHSLEHVTSEQDLLQAISGGLGGLRQAYPSNKSAFTSGDIAFLKNLNGILGQLQGFVELNEELRDVASLEEYEDAIGRLSHIKAALQDLPVVRRVAKEIRELNERLPGIQDQHRLNRDFRLNGRIGDLERDSRRCARRHPMVIRKGARDYFWGCSRYPFCRETAELTAAQRGALTLCHEKSL
jgi:hypothetical protein